MNLKNLSILTISLLILINIANFSGLLVFLNDSFIYFYFISKESLSLICHQQKEKLFSIGSVHTILCSRCTGIYSGALIINLILLRFSFIKFNWMKYFFFSIFLMLLDIIFYQLKFYKYSQIIAASSGLFFGSSSMGILYNGLKLYIKENIGLK